MATENDAISDGGQAGQAPAALGQGVPPQIAGGYSLPEVQDHQQQQNALVQAYMASQAQADLLQRFWVEQRAEMEQHSESLGDFKTQLLPLARIKKIMKSDEDVRMISAEAPVLFAKACEFFILELSLRSWGVAQERNRRTVMRPDVAAAVVRTEVFDFLVDVLPREEGLQPGLDGSGGGSAFSIPQPGMFPSLPPPHYLPPPPGAMGSHLMAPAGHGSGSSEQQQAQQAQQHLPPPHQQQQQQQQPLPPQQQQQHLQQQQQQSQGQGQAATLGMLPGAPPGFPPYPYPPQSMWPPGMLPPGMMHPPQSQQQALQQQQHQQGHQQQVQS